MTKWSASVGWGRGSTTGDASGFADAGLMLPLNKYAAPCNMTCLRYRRQGSEGQSVQRRMRSKARLFRGKNVVDLSSM